MSEKLRFAQRKDLLKKEKVFTRRRDEISRQRRALPWVKVEKPYLFDTPTGKQTLADLFDGRSQLIVYHFMFGPDPKWKEDCPNCSFLVDHIDGANLHLPHHDVTLLVVSRAPLSKIRPFKQRMSWRFKWVSSFGNDFNFDYHRSIESCTRLVETRADHPPSFQVCGLPAQPRLCESHRQAGAKAQSPSRH